MRCTQAMADSAETQARRKVGHARECCCRAMLVVVAVVVVAVASAAAAVAKWASARV